MCTIGLSSFILDSGSYLVCFANQISLVGLIRYSPWFFGSVYTRSKVNTCLISPHTYFPFFFIPFTLYFHTTSLNDIYIYIFYFFKMSIDLTYNTPNPEPWSWSCRIIHKRSSSFNITVVRSPLFSFPFLKTFGWKSKQTYSFEKCS